MKDFLNEEYEEAMELINKITDKRKKDMVLYYFRKMVRDEVPEDIALDNIKELIEKGIESLVQRTQFDNVERDEDEDDEDLEDPKDIIKSIKNQGLRNFAQFYYDNMKKDRAPKSAIVDMLQDIKDESFFGIPEELKTKKTKVSHNERTGVAKPDKSDKDFKYEKLKPATKQIKLGKQKEDDTEKYNVSYNVRAGNTKLDKKEKFKADVNMILQGQKGYKPSPNKKKEEDLYKGFESIKEENLFENFRKLISRKKPF